MKTLIAIDPGTTQSAFVKMVADQIVSAAIWENDKVRTLIDVESVGVIVCEQFECFGMPVGKESFETVRWTGRFEQTALDSGKEFKMIPRRVAKLHLCQSARAKDQNVRQALIDKYGGKACTKKGGSLHGISSHLWSALAIGVTYLETQITPEQIQAK